MTPLHSQTAQSITNLKQTYQAPQIVFNYSEAFSVLGRIACDD